MQCAVLIFQYVEVGDVSQVVADHHGRYPGIDAPGMTTELLCMLMSALGEATYWDLAEQDMDYLHVPPDDSPAVYGLPERLVAALAGLAEERLAEVAGRWSMIQDEWTRHETDPARFLPVLRELRRVAQQARGEAQKLLLLAELNLLMREMTATRHLLRERKGGSA